MSYALTVFAVDLDQITRACGSKDHDLLATIYANFDRAFANYAYYTQSYGPDAPSVEDALATMIRGEEPNPDYAFQYGYALQVLCEHLGTRLDGNTFSPCDDEHVRQVDQQLEKLGIPAVVQVAKLQFGALPARIPRADDFPSIGSIRAEAVRESHAAFERAARSIAEVPGDLGRALDEVRQWVANAAREGRGLVGFFC